VNQVICLNTKLTKN